jgi:hypothetical protein
MSTIGFVAAIAAAVFSMASIAVNTWTIRTQRKMLRTWQEQQDR